MNPINKLPAHLQGRIVEAAREHSGHEPTQFCFQLGAAALWSLLANPKTELSFWIYPTEPTPVGQAFTAVVRPDQSGSAGFEVVTIHALAVANSQVQQLKAWRKSDGEAFNDSVARLNRRIHELELQLATATANDKFNLDLIDEKNKTIANIDQNFRIATDSIRRIKEENHVLKHQLRGSTGSSEVREIIKIEGQFKAGQFNSSGGC